MTALSSIISAGGGAPAGPVAGTVKSITSGTASYGNYSSSQKINLAAGILIANSVLFHTASCNFSFGGRVPDNAMWGHTGKLWNEYGSTSYPRITFYKRTNAVDVRVDWTVVEYHV